MRTERLLVLGMAIAGVAAGAWFVLKSDSSASAKKGAGPGPVPVLMAKAQMRDVPLTLEVAGRTAAFESVTLKARVDGQVQAVSFAEGQHVRRGDVLLRLDPADFQAKLRQAEANLARDQAQAAKAQADVERYVALKAKGFVSDEKVGEMRTVAAERRGPPSCSMTASSWRASVSVTPGSTPTSTRWGSCGGAPSCTVASSTTVSASTVLHSTASTSAPGWASSR